MLVDGPSPKNAEKLTGRTRTNKTMVFDGAPDLKGKLVNVRADEAFLWGFKGGMVSKCNDY